MEAQSLPLRRWTRDEYARMVETGIIQRDERVELLDGEVVTMTPQHLPHAATVDALREVLQDVFGKAFRIRVQLPLALGRHSEPEPDIAVVAGGRWDFVADHPTTAALVVEVADASLGKDRLQKGRLYAKAGIPEYWIVDLPNGCLEVCREPGKQGYRSTVRLNRNQVVTPLQAPDVSVPVSDFLPPD